MFLGHLAYIQNLSQLWKMSKLITNCTNKEIPQNTEQFPKKILVWKYKAYTVPKNTGIPGFCKNTVPYWNEIPHTAGAWSPLRNKAWSSMEKVTNIQIIVWRFIELVSILASTVSDICPHQPHQPSASESKRINFHFWTHLSAVGTNWMLILNADVCHRVI